MTENSEIESQGWTITLNQETGEFTIEFDDGERTAKATAPLDAAVELHRGLGEAIRRYRHGEWDDD